MNFESLTCIKQQVIEVTPIASVFVRVRNEMEGIEEFWKSLSIQTAFNSLEIIFLDSGSTDGSLEFLLSLNVYVYSIDKSEFSFGSSCNLGMQLANSKWVYFFSGHVVLNQPDLIRTSLLNSIENQASGFFRQVPNYKIGASIYDKAYLKYAFKEYKNKKGPIKISSNENNFSNAASLICRNHWEEFAFEDVIASEDYFWSDKVLSSGHTILYFHNHSIQHSHDESFSQISRRVRINAEARFPNGVSYFKRKKVFLKVFIGLLLYSGKPILSHRYAKSHSDGYKF